MNEKNYEEIIEAILFTMGESVELDKIEMNKKETKAIIEKMMKHYENPSIGVKIIELDDAYQMCTKSEMYEYLIKIARQPKRHALTDVLLETLSIIAYRQPVTKLEIGKIRGVNSDHAVNRLVEYGLVYEAGRLDAPGRPALFATTEEFLRRFGVSSMVDLPTMNPEQEEEIIQEVEEELQMRLGAQEEEGSDPVSMSDAVEEVLKERNEEIEEYEEKEESEHAEDQN